MRLKPTIRTFAGSALLLSALILLGFVVALASARSRPVTLTDTQQGTRITYSAESRWVLFPGECIQINWTLENAPRTLYFPTVLPGYRYGEGVRSIFVNGVYLPGLTTLEDAPGGEEERFSPGETVTRQKTACIDYKSEPKLRVFFADGASQTYKLGLDSFFLRLEVWALIIGAAGALIAGLFLLRVPSKHTALRLTLWFSTALLLFYAFAFLRFPDFVAIYAFDALIFAAILTACLALAGYSVFRAGSFDNRVGAFSSKGEIRFAVVAFWLWVLAFGYAVPGQKLVSEFLWLPFFLWALMVGGLALWWARPTGTSAPPVPYSRRTRILIALTIALIGVARDAVLFSGYGLTLNNDSLTYIVNAQGLFDFGGTEGLPKRIFPYLFMSAISGLSASPIPLLVLQSAISAFAVGFLIYVISYRNQLFAILTGLLLSISLSIGTYNRAILTESAFVSFHLICFTLILWHAQRRHSLRVWELFAFGMFCGWTFIFRGTGLPMILPVVAIYFFLTRSWAKSLVPLAGFIVFLVALSTFNRLRYGEFGLIGRQDDTLASALFSYHLFSPENGPTSAMIDEGLRSCMGYIDYDDVPRHSSRFIYQMLNPCQLGSGGMDRDFQADVTASALREMVFSHPSEFARVLVEETGITLKLAASEIIFEQLYQRRTVTISRDQCPPYAEWCRTVLEIRTSEIDSPFLPFNELLTYPSQLYLAADLITSRSPAAMSFALLMLAVYLWMVTDWKLLIVLSTGLIFYQILSVTAAHSILPRYGIILIPFMILISALALSRIPEIFRQIRLLPQRRLAALIVALLAVFYISWANSGLRQSITAPLSARSGINLLQKYGIYSLDFEVYKQLIARSASAFWPETRPTEAYTDPLEALGAVYHPLDLLDSQVDRIRDYKLRLVTNFQPIISSALEPHYTKWTATYLPGYLQDMGASYLLLDEAQWAVLTETQRGIISDPANYTLIGEWHEGEESRRLYEVTGSGRTTYTVHEANGIVIFEQPDLTLDVYWLDEDNNGVFAVRVDAAAVASGETLFEGENGWSARLEDSPEGDYHLVIRDNNGEVVDSGHHVRRP